MRSIQIRDKLYTYDTTRNAIDSSPAWIIKVLNTRIEKTLFIGHVISVNMNYSFLDTPVMDAHYRAACGIIGDLED